MRIRHRVTASTQYIDASLVQYSNSVAKFSEKRYEKTKDIAMTTPTIVPAKHNL